MNRDEKWTVIAGQRRALVELLADLDQDEWERPSLCEQWRIRDVVGHLALTPQSPGVVHILALGLRARGNFDAVNRDLAVAHAARTPAELLAHCGSWPTADASPPSRRWTTSCSTPWCTSRT